jgi:hypothetical protein
VLVLAAAVAADEKAARDPDLPWLDNEFYKVNVEVRPRIELADQDNLDASQAYTIRSHVGLRAKPYYGFSALAELLNIWSLDDGSYHDGASTPNGDTTIADPEQTKLNRAWLQFERPQWWGAKAKGGRQRILFDDQRFVGNIGWRQGEQSFDAALGETSLGVDDLTIQYAYLWDIRRIFGDQGPRSVGARDWDSDSHLVRVHYTGFGSSDGSSSLKLSAFAYLLDFQGDAPANSSNSYGFRLAGQRDLGDDWTLKYVGSYAFQTDANDNPADYDAHYVWVSGDVGPKELGTLGVGYELLGSDGGDARFVTPLATAHKFNGFADVFLNNGGVRGLQDLNFTLAPKLPWKLSGKLIYHEFWSDHRNKHRGREIDGVLSRPINPYMTALTKFAYFDGSSSGPDDIYRVWFQLTFAY